nr:L-selectin-like [Cherax quadricarinatus]
MNFVLLATVVGLAACQFQQFRSPGRQFFSGQPQRFGVQADDVRGGSEYYYSWRHDGGRTYTGNAAASLCTSLGGGWQPVGISSPDEVAYINSIVGRERLQYTWTGGIRSGNGFRWQNGEPFSVADWSHTGGFSRPQPDNREGQENCLAILNNFYNDGIKWHDVACHHVKPVICERRA